jgi:hypothetical protein
MPIKISKVLMTIHYHTYISTSLSTAGDIFLKKRAQLFLKEPIILLNSFDCYFTEIFKEEL